MVKDDFLSKTAIPMWKEEFFKEHSLFQEQYPFSHSVRNVCMPFFLKVKEENVS